MRNRNVLSSLLHSLYSRSDAASSVQPYNSATAGLYSFSEPTSFIYTANNKYTANNAVSSRICANRAFKNKAASSSGDRFIPFGLLFSARYFIFTLLKLFTNSSVLKTGLSSF